MTLFTARETSIQDLFEVTRHPYQDNRAFSAEFFVQKNWSHLDGHNLLHR